MQVYQQKTSQKQPHTGLQKGRRVVILSDCKKTDAKIVSYVTGISEKRGMQIVSRDHIHTDSLSDLSPSDLGILSITNTKAVSNDLKKMLRTITEHEFRNVHIILPAGPIRNTLLVSHLRAYHPTLFTHKRVWQGIAQFHQEITRLIPT